MSLVYNRTKSERETAVKPSDYWPDGLATGADRAVKQQAIPRITGKDLQAMAGCR